MVEEDEVWLWSPMVVDLWGVEEVNWQLSSPPPSVTGLHPILCRSFISNEKPYFCLLTIKRS